MLSEFEEIERAAGSEKAADVRRALHFLLRRQFVFAGDPRTTTVYSTIMDGRFRNTIDGSSTAAATASTAMRRRSGPASRRLRRTCPCRA